MLNLNDREWKSFFITDILGESNNSKAYHSSNLTEIKQNGVPYVTRTSFNNGLYSVVKNTGFKLNPKNSISLGAENAEYFFQPYEYITGNKMYYYFNEKFNKYICLFLVQCLNKAIFDCGFGYGMGLTGTRSDTRKIMLPIDDNDEPDYLFMEQYMKEKEEQKLKQYIAYAQSELKKIKSDVEVKTAQLTWKDFRVEDVFNIVSGKDAVLVNNEGDIPYVNSSGVNNGITCFVKDCPVKVNNCITIARTGTVGSTFYQENEVGISGNIRALYLKDRELNKEIAQFLITALKNSIEGNFDYGKILGTERIKNLKIKLPVTADGNIDYKYMEAYIYIYIYICETERILGLYQRCRLIDREWDRFDLDIIFTNIQRGKRLTKENQIIGLMPYISSSAMNNGVDNFVSNSKDVRKFNHCLSLANSGSVGACFYQPFTFVASDHITHLKNEQFNQYQYLFIATLLSRLSEKYNFNREINDVRISNEKIVLPINEYREPDYEFMGKYARNMMIQKLLSYIN